MEGIRIYEIASSDTLEIISDQNSDKTFYDKKEMTVYGDDNYVVITNAGSVIIRALTEDFKVPYYPAVTDLVNEIQSYLDNLQPTPAVAGDGLITKIDETNSKDVYIGKANVQTTGADPEWQIMNLVITGKITETFFADGDILFDNVWDDRASLTYS